MIKKIFFVLATAGLLYACNSTTKDQNEKSKKENAPEGSYGVLIDMENALPASEIKDLMSENDTVPLKLVGEISKCCQHSGCWMNLKVDDETSIKVTFKDYDFTIPTDSEGKTVYIKGIAMKDLIPLETLHNYAKEDGKSNEEIAEITEPQLSFTFEASGVLIIE